MSRSSRFFPCLLFTALLLTLSPQTFAGNVAQGSWTKKTATVAGNWRVMEDGEGLRLVLGADFKTKSAPDLKILLSSKTVSQLTNKNALDGAVLVAELDRASGAQEYRMPAGVDLDSFATVIIHCEKYTKLWAVGSLR